MGTQPDEVAAAGAPGAEDVPESRQAVPEIRPWREVGWIFRDGDTLAIERQGERTRTRFVRVRHLRGE